MNQQVDGGRKLGKKAEGHKEDQAFGDESIEDCFVKDKDELGEKVKAKDILV